MLSKVHQNIIAEEMQLAGELLDFANRIRALRTRFDLNSTYEATASAQEVQETFPHLDQSKIGNGFNTFDAVVDALGDDISGNASALYLLKS